MSLPTPKPFKINVKDSLLSFIQQRVETARIPSGFNHPPGKEWDYGPPPEVMTRLKDFWVNKYDWRTVEARMNSHLKMFTLPIKEGDEEIEMHFVHHRSDREGAIPLLFQHGWPGNFLEVDKIIDLLTSPADPAAQAYHVVAPSLPGFVFSSAPKNPAFDLKNIAAINNTLMLSLGYGMYMYQGGDWGGIVGRLIAINYPENCIAIHLNFVPSAPPVWYRNPLSFVQFFAWAVWTASDKDGSLGRLQWWRAAESGYSEIQGTKPQTISYALADSPIGMLAWLRDKMEALVDTDFSWDDETTITWAMLYLIPQTSSAPQIYTNMKGKLASFQENILSKKIPSNVDFGASIFPKDVFNIPRFWAQACVADNIIFWKDHTKGGHFASVEKPDVLVEDIREFTKRCAPNKRSMLRTVGKMKL